jgi:hypothetical protein
LSEKIDIKNKLDKGLSFKISRFKEQIKKTNPHKHDEYFELIFLFEGEGFHCTKAGHIDHLWPEQIDHIEVGPVKEHSHFKK